MPQPSRIASGTSADDRILRRWLIAGGAVVLLALFARVMCEPLRHDEQMFFSDGWLFGRYALYRDINYGHLPNLPLLLSVVLHATGGIYKFLIARLLTFLCWVVFLYAFASIAWRLSKNLLVTGLAVLLIVTNSLFVEYEGMLVAVHLYPICFATLGFLCFLVALDGDRVRPFFIFLSGLFLSLAAGFKANYVIVVPPFAIAALFLPRALPFGQRLLRVALPLAIGGIICGLPTFYFFATRTDAFVFDVYGYFLSAHRAYWSEPENAATITGLSLPARILFGYRLWTSGATLLTIVMILYGVVLMLRSGRSAALQRLKSWPLLLCLALSVLGVAVSLAIKPSFPQYFMPPVPFAVLLLVCLLAALSDEQSSRARPLYVTIAIATMIVGGPLLLQDLPKLVRPSAWMGIKTHKIGMRIRSHVPASGGRETPLVATLSPIYVLDGGLDIYPELAAGPFYYRIGDYLSEEERRAYRVTSPSVIGSLFDSEPPDAILVGHEGTLDAPLQSYAETHGYHRVEDFIGKDKYGESVLYVRGEQ